MIMPKLFAHQVPASSTGTPKMRLGRLGNSALLLLSLCITQIGCTATSQYMTAVPPPAAALAPAAGKATVVFIRSSGLGGAIKFMIIEQNGRFMGESTAGGHFPAILAPGEYLFIAEGENTAVMHANLAPDRLYYVDVDPKMGVFSARVGLEPIKPGSDAWRKVPEMLNDTKRFIPLIPQGQAALDAESSDIQKRVANAKSKWAGYSPAERAELSLEPGDGVGTKAPAAPQPVAPVVAPQSPTPQAPALAAPAPQAPPVSPAAPNPTPVPGA